MSLPVSVCIPVRNEEENLPGCLASVSAFAEVVVVDSRSSDRTVRIAEQAGAQVLQFDWNGGCPEEEDLGSAAPSLQELVGAVPRRGRACCAGLCHGAPIQLFPERGTWAFGYPLSTPSWEADLRHGDSLRKLALFRPDCGEYEQFPEKSWSGLDMEVHEHPVLNGTSGEIRTRLRHHNPGPIESLLARHEEYSSLGSEPVPLASKLREPRRGKPSTNANDSNTVTWTESGSPISTFFFLSYQARLPRRESWPAFRVFEVSLFPRCPDEDRGGPEQWNDQPRPKH